MRVFWWQGGLHLEPICDADRAALVAIRAALLALNGIEIDERAIPGAVANESAHEQSIIGVQVGQKVIANLGSG